VQLISIGRFSRLTRLSIKALRLYDEIGLLPPQEVDEDSGYRYYGYGQVQRAVTIRLLRDLDMPLPEIGVIVGTDDPQAVRDRLRAHRSRVQERLAVTTVALARLEQLIERWEGAMPYQVATKEEAPRDVVCIAARTSLATIGQTIGECFGELMGYIQSHGLQMTGPPFVAYPDRIHEEEGTIECCFPIATAAGSEGRVESRHLCGGPVAWTHHVGPYDQVGEAYAALDAWVAENGRQMAGPPREVYLNDPQTTAPAELLTEVVWPLAEVS
jgi:DNA-binding transcriptional MerR regulator